MKDDLSCFENKCLFCNENLTPSTIFHERPSINEGDNYLLNDLVHRWMKYDCGKIIGDYLKHKLNRFYTNNYEHRNEVIFIFKYFP